MSDDSAVEPVAERGKRGKRGHYRVSARLQRVLLLLATGKAKTQIEACAAEGITTRALQLALRRESVRAFMQLTIMTELKVSAMRAATKMSELLNSENAMVQFRSSSYLLNTGAGIAPADNRGPLVNIGVASGSYVIDLRQDDEKAGPLTERDQAEVDAVRGGRSPGAVLLGRRGAPAGPVTIEGEAEVIDLPKRRADRDC